MLTDWPRSLTALVAARTSSSVIPATKRLERRLPMEVFSAIARMDLLSDNQMKKARSKLTFVPQDWPSRNRQQNGGPPDHWMRCLGTAGCLPATAGLRRAVLTIWCGETVPS